MLVLQPVKADLLLLREASQLLQLKDLESPAAGGEGEAGARLMEAQRRDNSISMVFLLNERVYAVTNSNHLLVSDTMTYDTHVTHCCCLACSWLLCQHRSSRGHFHLAEDKFCCGTIINWSEMASAALYEHDFCNDDFLLNWSLRGDTG